MNPFEYEAFRRLALRYGIWFVAQKSGTIKQFEGWTIPPYAEARHFHILIDGFEVTYKTRTEEVSGPLSDIFLRCGIIDPRRYIFSFGYQPVKNFPEQHVVQIIFDGVDSSKLLPSYICNYDDNISPPSANTLRTNHIKDSKVFQFTGQNDAGRLIALFEKHKRKKTAPVILDWGCGCGRVAKFMAQKFGQKSTFGVDVDPVNIDWNLKHLDAEQYKLVDFKPNLPFRDRFFDLVYAISVMTHLSAEHQKQWLSELFRVTADDGLVILSFHSYAQFFAGVNNGPQLERLIAEGFLDVGRCEDLDEGFSPLQQNDDYRNVFNSEENVRAICSVGFTLLDHYPGGLVSHDVVVLRKNSSVST